MAHTILDLSGTLDNDKTILTSKYAEEYDYDALEFKEAKVLPMNYPDAKGMKGMLWHLVSKEDKQKTGNAEDREYFIERSRRMLWADRIIRTHVGDERVKVSSKIFQRTGETRYTLWFSEHRYVVILEDKRHSPRKKESKVILVTAYYVDENYAFKSFEKEYEDYCNKNRTA